MKTAMQELIDWTIYQGSKRTVPEKEIIDMAKILLEKEKEQIIDHIISEPSLIKT